MEGKKVKSTKLQKIAADEYAVLDDGEMKHIVDANLSKESTYDLLADIGNSLAAYIYGEAESAEDIPDLVKMLRSGAEELTTLADLLEKRVS